MRFDLGIVLEFSIFAQHLVAHQPERVRLLDELGPFRQEVALDLGPASFGCLVFPEHLDGAIDFFVLTVQIVARFLDGLIGLILAPNWPSPRTAWCRDSR